MPIPISSTGQSYPPVLDYRIVQLIGGGGFSKVFRAVNSHSKSHPVAAIKVISYAPGRSNKFPIDRRALQKEVQVHSILKHANVLEFLGAVERGIAKNGQGATEKGILMGDAVATTQESKRAMDKERERREKGDVREENYVPGLYMILELGAGGDLFDKIAPDYGVEEDLAHFYFLQLMAGLEYIHSQGVAHRDIKPENMLLDAEGNLKIADFGLCSVYKYKGKEREMHGACGSLPYIAPEMNGKPYKGEPVDVWSSGVVLFALLVGSTPWDEPTSRSPEYSAFISGHLFRYDPWTRIPPDALSLLKKMLNPRPEKRASFEQIKRHRWYMRKNDLITQKGRCNDPVNLAEKLLQGLAVSGDISIDIGAGAAAKLDLHTDGKRAEIPENVSLTQPEAIQKSSLELGLAGSRDTLLQLPSSTAMPAIAGGGGDDASRRLAMSQQISHRRMDFPGSIALPGSGAAPEASQFTQALNHFTQFDTLVAGGTHARFSPHLTRFFSTADAATVTTLIAEMLDLLAVQKSVEPMGESEEIEEAYSFMVHGDPGEVKSASSGGDDRAASPLTTKTKVGTRGARIRLGTMDKRKCPLRGEVRIEILGGGGSGGSQGGASAAAAGARAAQCLVIMRRSKGNPLEWRRLFREICKLPAIRETILST
ncbi:Chk1 protein kinase [Thecaphora frezii]